MNYEPPVSIFIVTYLSSEERCAVLKRTCEGALTQRYSNFEVVVSDNGGSYSAHDALASLNDPRLKIYGHAENVGFTGNMNRCLEHCSHNIIKPICDDDLIHPDFLKLTVPLIDDETLVVVDVEKYLVGRDPAFAAIAESPDATVRAAGYGRDIWALPYAASCIPSATLFTRKLFRSLGGYDRQTIISDWDFFIEVGLHRRIVHLPQTLCFVGVWAGSLTEEMQEKPFFFPLEGLYTKFRVYHCKNMVAGDRSELLRMLLRELFFEMLRPLKHLHRRGYREGACDYIKRFFQLLRQDQAAFTSRPFRQPLCHENSPHMSAG